MGQAGSTIHRLFKPNTKDLSANKNQSQKSAHLAPFVYERESSLFEDEDGDFAHEFFIEVPTKNGVKMVKIPNEKLKAVGYIAHSIPRLNTNLPILFYEVKS